MRLLTTAQDRAQSQRYSAARTSWLYGAGSRRGSRNSGGRRLLGLVIAGAITAFCDDSFVPQRTCVGYTIAAPADEGLLTERTATSPATDGGEPPMPEAVG